MTKNTSYQVSAKKKNKLKKTAAVTESLIINKGPDGILRAWAHERHDTSLRKKKIVWWVFKTDSRACGPCCWGALSSWAGGKWRVEGCRVHLHISVMHLVSKRTEYYSWSISFLTDSHLSLTGLTGGGVCAFACLSKFNFKGWVWGRVRSFVAVVVFIGLGVPIFTSCSESDWAPRCLNGPALRCHSPSHRTGPGFT